MSKIMIVGAGRVGQAAAKIVRFAYDHDLVIVDAYQGVIDEARSSIMGSPASTAAGTVAFHVAGGRDAISATMLVEKPDVVICATPFTINITVAQLAAKHGIHYVDFTEDVDVTREITNLGISRLTFVPQTGLAPGLINYIGLSLFDELGAPSSLNLRVGALPQVSFGPAFYAITWSPEGLINEYLKPAFRKRGHIIEEVQPMDEHEMMMVDGRLYEGFTTSGGVGDLGAYDDVPSVEYKTLRHPGHLEFAQKLLARSSYDLDAGVKMAKELFTRTRDDVVVLAALATDDSGMARSIGYHFRPHAALGLTALELTTAGTGVAVVDLILQGLMPAGVLKPNDVPYDELSKTPALRLVMASRDNP